MTLKRKVLHLSPSAACGGCEFNCLRVIQGLNDCEHQVVVFAGRGPMSGEWETAGARVMHLNAWLQGSRKFEKALEDWSETQLQPEAVMYWSTSRLLAVQHALRGWDAPWVVYLGNPVQPGIVAGFRRRLSEWLHPPTPGVILVACSSHVAESHRRAFYYRRLVMEVIYNAVDPAFDQIHHYRSLPSGSAPRIGMVARLDRIKDHRTVIRALASMVSVRPDVVVEFAGDGPLRDDLEREARRLNVDAQVRFLGTTPVGKLLRNWDIYVHSTTESEGMGTAVAEAMTAGLPCIVSDLAAMREVCGQEGAAYAPAGDEASLARGLLRMLEDRAWREALGEAAQVRARRMFGLPQIASAYFNLVFSTTAKELR